MTECIVCNNNKNFKNKFEILLECEVCGHIFADIKIDFKKISEIYSDKYFFGDEYIDYIDDKKQIEKNSLIRNKLIKKYTLDLEIKKLYEIGCAYGFFLNKVRKDYNIIQGIDVNKNAIIFAKEKLNLSLDSGDFLNLKYNNSFFNIFCMFDVIEHLDKPDLFLNKINQIAEKNSYLFLTTGDIKSYNARFKGKKWRLIHPPTHIHYFSKKSITKLLNKYNFDVINIQYNGSYRNLNFILNKIPFYKKYFNWFNVILKFFKLDKFDLYINLYDIMFVVAKKNE